MACLRLIGYVISKIFWFIKYRGIENIPDRSDGGLLIASNHQTYIDPVWICLPMNHRLRFMAFDKAFGWRVIGPFIRYLGAFPVSLDPGGTISAMKRSLNTLNDGAALTIFPEGGREFADGKFLPFRSGVVQLGLHTGVPVLPVTINGGNRIWPQKQKYPRLFRRVEIIYHPVLRFDDLDGDDQEERLANAMASLQKAIGSEYRA
ncbi:MAG: lysophospholipid acyltransferase family protein [Pyrinomonadaceae bacterium]